MAIQVGASLRDELFQLQVDTKLRLHQIGQGYSDIAKGTLSVTGETSLDGLTIGVVATYKRARNGQLRIYGHWKFNGRGAGMNALFKRLRDAGYAQSLKE